MMTNNLRNNLLNNLLNNWQPNSWRSLPIKQQPIYQNIKELTQIEEQLAKFTPLVSVDEVENLKNELA